MRSGQSCWLLVYVDAAGRRLWLKSIEPTTATVDCDAAFHFDSYSEAREFSAEHGLSHYRPTEHLWV